MKQVCYNPDPPEPSPLEESRLELISKIKQVIHYVHLFNGMNSYVTDLSKTLAEKIFDFFIFFDINVEIIEDQNTINSHLGNVNAGLDYFEAQYRRFKAIIKSLERLAELPETKRWWWDERLQK